MKRTNRLIRSMDGPIRVLGHLMSELRHELDKTARDLQEEMPLTDTGIEGRREKIRALKAVEIQEKPYDHSMRYEG